LFKLFKKNSTYFDSDKPTLDGKVAEIFLNFFVLIFGDYANFLKPTKEGKQVFDTEKFLKAKEVRTKKFLEVFTQQQLFHGFIQDRETEHTFNGEFESLILRQKKSL